MAGSCAVFILAGAGIGGIDSLIGTSLFFLSGATVRSGSISIFFVSPGVAALGIFFGETRSSFVLLAARGLRGRIVVASASSACFDESFALERFKFFTASGFSDDALPCVLSFSAKDFDTRLPSFSSPNFLLEPAFKNGRVGASASFAGFGSSVEVVSVTEDGLFLGSSFGCAGASGRGSWSDSPMILGLGSSTPVDLVGLSILTGSSSTKRDVGGGPRSGESFVSAASVHTARSSA